MDETQKLLIQGYGSAYLLLSIDWRTHESWFEVNHVTQKTKYKTFAEAAKAMQEVMQKERKELHGIWKEVKDDEKTT